MEIKPVPSMRLLKRAVSSMYVKIEIRGLPSGQFGWRWYVLLLLLLDFFPFYNAFAFDYYRNKNVMNHKHTYEASNEVNSQRASIAQFIRFSSFNVTNYKQISESPSCIQNGVSTHMWALSTLSLCMCMHLCSP